MAKLPPNAQKVFDGIIYDVYHWEQKMFDGSTATFEMLKRPNTLEVIATVGDKILLNKECQPAVPTCYTLPGGRQDPGETPMEGAARELLEETGYVAPMLELYKSWQPLTKIDWEVYIFIGRNAKKIQEPEVHAGEDIDVQLVSFDEFIDHVLGQQFWGQEFIQHILRLKLQPGALDNFRKHIFGES